MRKNTQILDFLGQFTIALIPIGLLIGTAISESLILVLIIIFLTKIILTRDTVIFKNVVFYSLIIIWISLIINFFFSLDLGVETLRNLTFFKYILMTLGFIYFFNIKKNVILWTWALTLAIVVIDIYFEFFVGHNLVGIKSHDPNRIASFLGNELKIGHFVTGFGFLCLGSFMKWHKNRMHKYKLLYNLIFFILIVSIFIIGERANFIRGLLLALILMNFINKNYITKFIIVISILLIIIFCAKNFERIENRFFGQVIKNIYEKGFVNYFKESHHGAHFDVAINIFKKYPYFGVGNKNFRVECQKKEYYNPSYNLSYIRCSTHPHQIYYELLSEHGIIGTLTILSVIFYIIYKNIIIYQKKKDIIHLSSILFCSITFLPLVPSGSFFSSFGATIFWINFSIMCYFYLKFHKKILNK